MPTISDFPNGFQNGVSIRNVPLTIASNGRVIWVNNSAVPAPGALTGADASGAALGTFKRPYASINYASAQAVAHRGDIIMVCPGHIEAVATATALSLATAGVTVIGLGAGADIPIIDLTVAAATINVSAPSVTFKNMKIRASFAGVAVGITATTAIDFRMEDILIANNSGVTNARFTVFLQTNTTANAADGLVLLRCRKGDVHTSETYFIQLQAAINRFTMQNNFIMMGVNNNNAIINAGSSNATEALLDSNTFERLNTSTSSQAIVFQSSGTGSSGIAQNNFTQHATSSGVVFAASTGLGYFQNFSSAAVGTSGSLNP